MADRTVYFDGDNEPIKIYRNKHRPGLIIRQSKSVIFADLEVAEQLVEALDDLLTESEAER
ncbi:MAG: hypothetical protein INR66_13045 [Gordonia polyisoprenivorans]|nr:hypothetical protein [Gordonia polyisoprenivorans]